MTEKNNYLSECRPVHWRVVHGRPPLSEAEDGNRPSNLAVCHELLHPIALVFDVLGLVCGAYLCWLGVRSATARRGADGTLATEPRRPLARGLMFGLSNPKAYPVAVAMFTALLARYADALDWRAFAPLLGAACVGFIAADCVLVGVIGVGVVRRFYRRHALWVTRASGVLFLGFGVHAIVEAGPGILKLDHAVTPT